MIEGFYKLTSPVSERILTGCKDDFNVFSFLVYLMNEKWVDNVLGNVLLLVSIIEESG